ncbi:MAG TPA: hypothetical protein PKH31_04500 [Candidatus Sumerlaeota bacterium]|nr:hypothetical protein [Candidatus Sumerlaeota bacterium]
MTDKRYVYDILKEPVGRDYERLLLCLYPHGERLVFASKMRTPLVLDKETISKFNREGPPEIDEEALSSIGERGLIEGLVSFVDLVPHLIQAEFRDRWPGGILLGHKALVYEFSCNSQTINIVLAHTTGLYDFDWSRSPDDLAIIRPDGTVLLGTTSHENEGYLILRNDEHKDLLQEVPSLRLKKSPEGGLENYRY